MYIQYLSSVCIYIYIQETSVTYLPLGTQLEQEKPWKQPLLPCKNNGMLVTGISSKLMQIKHTNPLVAAELIYKVSFSSTRTGQP